MSTHALKVSRRFFASAILAVACFASACDNRVSPAPAPKPQPPPPFEFLGSWGEKGEGPGKLNGPVSFAADNLGNLLFVDPAGGFVHKFESNGTPLLSFEESSVRRATGISVDSGGAIYVSNAAQGSILVYFPDGTFLQSWHTSPERHLTGPLGIGIDEEGTLYVPAPGQSRVLKLSSHGRLLKSWAAPQKALSPEERPSWICAAPGDALFVAYFATGRVEKFGTDGSSVTAWPAAATAAGDPAPLTGFAANADYVFTMAADSSQIRVWTKDGLHKLDADLSASIGKIAAPQLAVTPRSELLVFDPAAPKIFRFRMHLKEQEPT